MREDGLDGELGKTISRSDEGCGWKQVTGQHAHLASALQLEGVGYWFGCQRWALDGRWG
jgi:hypothetical protein